VKAAEPQHAFRAKPEAAVKTADLAAARQDASLPPVAAPEAEDASLEPPAELSAGTRRVAAKTTVDPLHAAAARAAEVPAAAMAESSATESAAPAAEAAIGAGDAAPRGERQARDTTVAMPRVPASGPTVAPLQAQAGGGDAHSFEQDSRRSPAAQRLAAALSAASGAPDAGTGSAPVFSVPSQPGAAAAPVAAAAPLAPAVPAQVDAENVETLVQAMRVTARAGGWEATVRLKPEHMGEVTIALRVDGKHVSAVVQAESAGVRQWLASQEDAVRSGMSDHGLQLDRFMVSRDGQRREAEEQQQPQQQQRRRAPRQANTGNEPRFEVVA
jgi:flagellar hook-length control protein FliK